MKALSFWQPWAEAMLTKRKDIENRRWPTSTRGTILVHAAKKIDIPSFRACDEICAKIGLEYIEGHKVFLGGFIGQITIVDCVPVEKVSTNPWAFGPWCWILKDPVKFKEPFPYRGQQGFWEVNW